VGWLDDIVVLATGAGSGIGRAVVDAFVKEGAKVGVLELMPEKAERLRSELGDSVVVVEGDATILGDNERAVDATVASFGRIDVLSTFVGVFDFFHYLRDMPKEKVSDGFDEIFTTNVKSNVLSVKAPSVSWRRRRCGCRGCHPDGLSWTFAGVRTATKLGHGAVLPVPRIRPNAPVVPPRPG